MANSIKMKETSTQLQLFAPSKETFLPFEVWYCHCRMCIKDHSFHQQNLALRAELVWNELEYLKIPTLPKSTEKTPTPDPS